MFFQHNKHKKLLDELRYGEPIEPVHETPESLDDSEIQLFINDADRRFFRDFQFFADFVNEVYTAHESWEGGPWRLQQMKSIELENFSYERPEYGRQYIVYFNRVHMGTVEIQASWKAIWTGPDGLKHGGYCAKDPLVDTIVTLDHVRFLGFDTVYGFLHTIARGVSCKNKKELAEAEQRIRQAMLAAVWRIDPDGETDTSIELTFLSGSAKCYLLARSGLAD